MEIPHISESLLKYLREFCKPVQPTRETTREDILIQVGKVELLDHMTHIVEKQRTRRK